jgi:hypothetical protein
MQFPRSFLRDLIFGRSVVRPIKARRARQMALSCDSLEGRVTPAHIGVAHHALAHLHAAAHHASASESASATTVGTLTTGATSTNTATRSSATGDDSTTTGSSSSSSSCGSSDSSSDSSRDSSTSSSSSTLSSALQTLRTDIETIESASGTTVAQLAAIATAFDTLKSDGLAPSSQSALKSFENTLATDFASGMTLTGNSTLLSEFEALYTSSPTTQETTDLTTAYNALAAAVTSSNITSADITTINTDWAAVLAAEGSTSTNTFPYYELVTGQALFHQNFGGEGYGGGRC